MNLHFLALQQVSVLSSQHVGQPLLTASLPEGADGLQRGFAHRVPQLLEQHPEEQQQEAEEPEEQPHVEAQVPAPGHSQGQRGGRHQELPGGRHGVRQPPALPNASKAAPQPVLDFLRDETDAVLKLQEP